MGVLRTGVYLVVLELTVLSAVALNSPVGYTPMYLVLLVSVFSVLYALLCRRCVHIDPGAESPVFIRSRPGAYSVTFRNAGPLFVPHVYAKILGGGKQKTEHFALPPHGEKTVKVSVLFEHVGQFRVGLRRTGLYGLLGVLPFVRRHSPATAVVVPAAQEIAGIELRRQGGLVSGLNAQYARMEENENYTGVREYVPGDSLKNIHWKLTAHTAQYMSREYEISNRDGVSVYLDLSLPGLPDREIPPVWDCLAESAVSAVALGVSRGLSARLVYSGGGKTGRMELEAYADLGAASVRLAGLCPGGGSDLGRVIGEDTEAKACHENLFVCTANLTDELAALVAELPYAGIRPFVFVARADSSGQASAPEALRYLVERGVDCRVIRSAEELAQPGAMPLAAAAGEG